MEKAIQSFLAAVHQRNQNEPEFMQAVTEVAETVIPTLSSTISIMGKIFSCAW